MTAQAPITQATHLADTQLLSFDEAAFLLGITAGQVRRVFKGNLPITVGKVRLYDAEHPHRLKRRYRQGEPRKFLVWMTDNDAQALEQHGYRVVDPRKVAREAARKRREKALAALSEKAG